MELLPPPPPLLLLLLLLLAIPSNSRLHVVTWSNDISSFSAKMMFTSADANGLGVTVLGMGTGGRWGSALFAHRISAYRNYTMTYASCWLPV